MCRVVEANAYGTRRSRAQVIFWGLKGLIMTPDPTAFRWIFVHGAHDQECKELADREVNGSSLDNPLWVIGKALSMVVYQEQH
jgi:hypothetical protein